MVLNLQSTALKFTPKGGSVSIVTTLLNDPPSLQIEVKDTGMGIKEEDKPKLFKLFGFLTETQEVNAKGIGLGLHICKKLANKLNGDITLESEWQKGSTFTLTMPLDELPT
jgi:signal transduction histidine kinase